MARCNNRTKRIKAARHNEAYERMRYQGCLTEEQKKEEALAAYLKRKAMILEAKG